MNHRRPAAGHGNCVARNFFQHGAFASLGAEGDTLDPFVSLDLADGFSGLDTNAKVARARNKRAVCVRARIDDGRDCQACLGQRDGGSIGIIVIGDDNRAIANADAEIDRIIAHGPPPA